MVSLCGASLHRTHFLRHLCVLVESTAWCSCGVCLELAVPRLFAEFGWRRQAGAVTAATINATTTTTTTATAVATAFARVALMVRIV